MKKVFSRLSRFVNRYYMLFFPLEFFLVSWFAFDDIPLDRGFLDFFDIDDPYVLGCVMLGAMAGSAILWVFMLFHFVCALPVRAAQCERISPSPEGENK